MYNIYIYIFIYIYIYIYIYIICIIYTRGELTHKCNKLKCLITKIINSKHHYGSRKLNLQINTNNKK